MPIIIHSLGDRMYGLWVLVGAFMGYYGFLDLGLFSATSRFISRALGRGDEIEMNEVFNNSLLLFTAIGLFVFLLSILISYLSGFFLKDPAELHIFRFLLILLGINSAISFPIMAFRGILISYLRFDLIAYANIIRLLIANLLIYFFLKEGYGIIALGVITFATGLLENLLIVGFTRKVFSAMIVQLSIQKRQKFRELFSYSWKTVAVQAGDLLRNKLDVFIIAGYLSVNLVTYYALAARIIRIYSNIIISTLGIFRPIFSQYEGQNDFDSIKEKFLQIHNISVPLSLFIGLSIIFYGKSFILRWMGDDFTKSYIVLIILCSAFMTEFIQFPSNSLLYGISKHQYYAISNFIEGIFNLLLSLILVRFYGLYGVAFGTAIPMIFIKLLVQPVYVCRTIDLPVLRYYWYTLFVPGVKTIFPLVIFFYFTRNFLEPNFIRIFQLGTLQTLLFLPYAFFIIFDNDLQILLKESFKKKRSKPS